ncbi:MAG: hypothetical protein CM1200mP29_11660 [Verrucomicrobiota bacterium]|nr:MAG: hypothetical protein CM1200mP29_11660 [Verrucomicrobiota bacterium]
MINLIFGPSESGRFGGSWLDYRSKRPQSSCHSAPWAIQRRKQFLLFAGQTQLGIRGGIRSSESVAVMRRYNSLAYGVARGDDNEALLQPGKRPLGV